MLVKLDDLVAEVKDRMKRMSDLDNMVRQAEGLKVVHGIKAEPAALSTVGEKGESTLGAEATASVVPSSLAKEVETSGEAPVVAETTASVVPESKAQS